MDHQGNLYLVEASVELADEIRDYAEDFARSGERFFLERWPLATPADVTNLVQALQRRSEGVGLRGDQVPLTNYFLQRADGVVLGSSRLRHVLDADLHVEGGHIGYDIRPSQRRRGYGTRILALTLEKARERGIDPVLVTCDDDNVGSARIIERNGGVLQDRVISPDSGKSVRRYWIDLNAARGARPNVASSAVPPSALAASNERDPRE